MKPEKARRRETSGVLEMEFNCASDLLRGEVVLEKPVSQEITRFLHSVVLVCAR